VLSHAASAEPAQTASGAKLHQRVQRQSPSLPLQDPV
jgi:hypothetical protein